MKPRLFLTAAYLILTSIFALKTTTAAGMKVGKTELGAVYLDPARTSVYKFYQYWIRTDDRDVIQYLKYFTFLSHEEITELEKAHAQKPEAREAHKALAKSVTDLVHSPAATQDAMRASEILFGGGLFRDRSRVVSY